jgi:hypothetical protein
MSTRLLVATAAPYGTTDERAVSYRNWLLLQSPIYFMDGRALLSKVLASQLPVGEKQ